MSARWARSPRNRAFERRRQPVYKKISINIIEMNLLDLNNDILNIIGDYFKKDNLERKIIKDRQIRSDK